MKFPTHIADNEFLALWNIIWSGNEMKVRDGFTTYYDMSEIVADSQIWGLYRYYKQDGSRITLAGINEELWVDTNTSGNFIKIKDGLQSNDKYYYFDTFKDRAIVAHEGDHPFYYCYGCTPSIRSIGRMDSVYGSYTHDAADCQSLIYGGPNVDWTNDQWAGYVVQWDRYTASPRYLYHFIDSNSVDTLYAEGHNQYGSTQLFYYRILPYFITENPILSDTVDSMVFPAGDTCMQGIYFANTLSASMLDTPYVAKVRGEEKFLVNVTANGITVNAHFDTLQVGDSIFICKKSFYHGRMLKAYKNRIFIAGDQLLANTIYFSDYNDYDDFPPDNYLVVKTEDGEHVTALATFYDDQLGYKENSKDCLVIFTENSIWKLVWNSSTDYYLVQVTEGVGCVAPKTVVSIEGKYIIFLHTSGVYAFDGRTVTYLSRNIEDGHLGGISLATINEASAALHKRHYYLAYNYAGGSHNDRTYCYSIDHNAWSEFTNIKTALWCEQRGYTDTCKLLFAHPQDKSLIFKFGGLSGESETQADTGQPIQVYILSKIFNLDDIHKEKRFVYFDMNYRLCADSALVEFYHDFSGNELCDYKVTDAGATHKHIRIPIDSDELGRNFCYRVRSWITPTNYFFELGDVSLKYIEVGE